MRLGLAIVLEILVQLSVVAEQHTRIEEVVVDCEDFGHDVEGVQAERIGGKCLAKHSLEDGEGPLGEFVDVDACGYAVLQGAGLDDDCLVAQAVAVLVEACWRRSGFEVLWRLIVRCTDCAHRAHDCRARTVGCVLGFRVGIFEVRLSRTVIFDVRGFARQCWLRSDRNMRFALAGMTLRGGSHDGERFLLGDALAARGLPSSLLGSCHGGDL